MQKIILACLASFAVTAEAAVNQEVISGLNQFAFTSHQHLYKADQSAVYSPYSIGVLLELLVKGGAGQTRDELMHAFGLKNTDRLNADIDELNQSLTQDKDVIISNAFWVDKQFNFSPSYINGIKQMQSVTMYPVDFANSGAAVKNQINDWAEKSTRGYIKSLLSDPLADNTKLVLTNAVYFKGLWALPFDSKQTSQQAFTNDQGSKSMLAMMHRSDRFHYTENEKLQMLILSYDHSKLAMALILPKTGHTLQSVSSQLTADQFKLITDNAGRNEQQVEVTIPKFKYRIEVFNRITSRAKNVWHSRSL